MRHARSDYNRIQDPENKIPADEPVFLIRGQDRAAVATIRAYALFAEREGASEGFINLTRAWATEVETWQAANRERVKVPDVPKERAGLKCPECPDGLITLGVCDTCGFAMHAALS